MCLFDVPETPRTVGRSDHYGMITGAYTIFEAKDQAASKWIEAFYIAMDDRKLLSPLYSGLRNTIPRPKFLGTKTPSPPPEEQHRIVSFIGYLNRKVSRFIRNRRRLIEVLNEQKQAIIARAVTQGLDPNASLKPSGVDWMGDIPKAWKVLRAKYLFKEVDTRSRDGSETHLSMSQKFGLVPASQLTERHFHSISYAGGKLVDEGDIVLNRLKAHLGVFRLAKQAGVISPDYTVLRTKRRYNARYFELVLTSSVIRPELRCRVKGLVEGFWRLYTDDFYDIRLPVPPAQEQERVVDSCKTETAELDATIRAAEREIDLMREYRNRLIADVVTGKIDVRHLASPPGGEDLEEMVEEIEPLDGEPGELDEEFMDGEVSNAND